MTHSHIARRSSFRLIKLNSDALVINDDQKLWTEVDLYITHAITDYTRKYNITAIVHCTRGMSKSFGESIRLFKPLFAAGNDTCGVWYFLHFDRDQRHFT